MNGALANRASGLVLAVLCAGSAGCHNAQVQSTPTAPSSGPSVPITSSASAIARAKADSARLPYTKADIAFMTGMIGHHAQAIVMSRMAPTHGASPEIRTLAARIINSQQDEITAMQRWLRDRQQPVPDEATGAMPMMMHDMPGMRGSMMHTMLMPGMLTEEQMKTLHASRKKAFDENYLIFMMQHHRGALSMVKDLFAADGAGQDELVFKFASDANVDQTTEIARMERMLFMLKLEKK
ncbi:MAG: DUF305 domain-containing protein [Gemmatimonadaceae bacterium]